MTEEKILEGLMEVLQSVRPSIDPQSVGKSSLLREDLGFDSLGMLLMGFGIENKFGIVFDGGIELNNVQEVVDYIMKTAD